MRRAAAPALLEFRSEKTVAPLRKALADDDFEVRMYAAEALKSIEQERPWSTRNTRKN